MRGCSCKLACLNSRTETSPFSSVSHLRKRVITLDEFFWSHSRRRGSTSAPPCPVHQERRVGGRGARMCACACRACAFSSASAIAPLRAMKVSGLRGTCGLAIGFFHPAERTWTQEDEGEVGCCKCVS